MSIEKIKPDDMSFDTLMTQIKNGYIKIPDFQRDFVWERTQIIDLLDSIYKHYPIGSFLFWESNDKICAYKNIGNIELKAAPEGHPINYVLDGQQRITSLFASVEEAEIKVKVNGKLKKKKLQICFNLDTKCFMPFNEETTEDLFDKNKYIDLLPNPTKPSTKHTDNILIIFSEIETTKHSEKSLIEWFRQYYNVTNSSAKSYVNTLLKTGFVSNENDFLTLSYLARDFKEYKKPEILIKALIRNVAYFSDVIEQVLEKSVIDGDELLEYITENYHEEWERATQPKRRLKWLWKLGYGEYKKGEFKLNPETNDTLRAILNEEKEIESKDSEKIPDDGIKSVSIRDILSDDKMFEIHSQLTLERQKSFTEVHKAFRNYKFSVIYVKDQPIGTVCLIFERINNSGKVLNVVDLMVAKTWSNTFNLKEKLYEFQKELRKQNFEDIADITILQCLSTNLLKNCKRKDILELTRENLEQTWKNSTESIKRSVDFLKANINISNSKILPFGVLLIPLSYFYFKLGKTDETSEQKKILVDWFWKACVSNRFDAAVEGRIAEDIKKIDLILEGKPATFDYIIPIITKDRIRTLNYSLGSAFCKTIMCIFASINPKNLQNNSPVDFNSFSKFNAIEFHHLFPQNYLKNEQEDCYELKDSIANIAFIHSGANKKYSDKAPNIYISNINNPEIDEAFKSHMIFDYKNSGLLENDFDKFINIRSDAILLKIKSLVGDFDSIGIDMLQDKNKQVDLFEKNMRNYLDNTLRVIDSDYWINKVSGDFRKSIEDRIQEWLLIHPHERKEKVNPLEYCLVMDYFKIIKSNWDVFEPIFKSKTELEKHFVNINELRRSIKHLRDIDPVTEKLAEGSLLWFIQIMTK